MKTALPSTPAWAVVCDLTVPHGMMIQFCKRFRMHAWLDMKLRPRSLPPGTWAAHHSVANCIPSSAWTAQEHPNFKDEEKMDLCFISRIAQAHSHAGWTRETVSPARVTALFFLQFFLYQCARELCLISFSSYNQALAWPSIPGITKPSRGAHNNVSAIHHTQSYMQTEETPH